MPLHAEVIDDFSGPKKFLVNGEPSASACSLADGQLKITVPEGESWAAALYLRNHLLPEGQAVEFRTDLVSASHAGVEVGLFVEFAGPYRTYGVVRWYDRVVLYKGWEDGGCGFFDRAVETRTEPLTLSLTLTRQGSSLKVASKVTLRDNPQEVIADWEILDTPDADPAELDTDGPAPPLGLITDVGVVCLGPDSLEAEAVFDNLECLDAPTLDTMTIQKTTTGEVELGWKGASILLEADSVLGPWRPRGEPPGDDWDGAGYRTALLTSPSQRFLRLASGRATHELFNAAPPKNGMAWRIGPVSAGGTATPRLGQSGGRGRIVGAGSGNVDFVLKYGLIGWPLHDCVTSVDILDWDVTMEDAAFGLVLRAKPATDLWAADTDGLPHDRYAGLLTFKKADSPSESVLSLTGPGGEVLELRRFPAVDPARQYRLRFWAVGDRLTLELFDFAQLEIPIVTCAATDSRIPAGLDALCGTKSASARYDVTIDNWVLNGVSK